MNLYNTNKKYKNLIDTAWSLATSFGIKRITVEEICEKADVSKVTFYKFFKNKDDLLMQVMKNFANRAYDEYNQIIKKDMPFLDKLEEVISFKNRISQNYTDEFINDFFITKDFSPEVAEMYTELTCKATSYDLALFTQGQREGFIRDDINPEFFLYLFDHSRIMINDEKLKAIIPDLHERIKLIINTYYYGLVRRDRNNASSGTKS